MNGGDTTSTVMKLMVGALLLCLGSLVMMEGIDDPMLMGGAIWLLGLAFFPYAIVTADYGGTDAD